MAFEKEAGLFVDGVFEIVIVAVFGAMLTAFVTAFNSLPAGSQSVTVLVEAGAIMFLVSLVYNFIKGMLATIDALISVAGMIVGIIIFGAAIAPISSAALPEVIAYIIAAIVGILVAAYANK